MLVPHTTTTTTSSFKDPGSDAGRTTQPPKNQQQAPNNETEAGQLPSEQREAPNNETEACDEFSALELTADSKATDKAFQGDIAAETQPAISKRSRANLLTPERRNRELSAPSAGSHPGAWSSAYYCSSNSRDRCCSSSKAVLPTAGISEVSAGVLGSGAPAASALSHGRYDKDTVELGALSQPGDYLQTTVDLGEIQFVRVGSPNRADSKEHHALDVEHLAYPAHAAYAAYVRNAPYPAHPAYPAYATYYM